MVNDTVRWGVVGCSRIAGTFASALSHTPKSTLCAVASRDGDRAKEFAAKYGASRHYGSYGELFADSDVDAVYVATVNTTHAELAQGALLAGKPVLCEKPLTINARQTRQLIELASARRLFLMEALWTRCQPVYDTVRSWLASGEIGQLRLVRGDFSIPRDDAATGREFDPAQGGGVLLDLGVYALAMARWLFAEAPKRIVSIAHRGATGVDETDVLVLEYSEGRVATFTLSFRAEGIHDLDLCGARGRIHVPGAWWASEAELYRGYNQVDVAKTPEARPGFAYEIEEAARCIRAGLLESPKMQWQDSQWIAETMDGLRENWGVVYPDD